MRKTCGGSSKAAKGGPKHEIRRRVQAARRRRAGKPGDSQFGYAAAVIMEVCGGQTHTIVKNGLEDLLPSQVTLVHGPGCPVCVTPSELIDAAVALAMRPGTILCSFGDMLRVPGSRSSLLDAKAAGSTVRVVY